jgi:hypothetical protein
MDDPVYARASKRVWRRKMLMMIASDSCRAVIIVLYIFHRLKFKHDDLYRVF